MVLVIDGLGNSYFQFNIKYRPGKLNMDADILSHLPLDMEKYEVTCTGDLSKEAVCAT